MSWEITIFFSVNSKNNVVRVFSEYPPVTKKNYQIKSIVFKMRPFTWQIYRDFSYQCARNGNLNDIDYLLMKEKKIVHGILDWNIVDENGKKVEITKENIFNLNPKIVELLCQQYDELSYITKKEKRNITLNVNKYYLSQVAGSGQVQSPPEIVELSLMEKFNWTPSEIDKIPYKKIQELFLVLNQREISSENAIKLKHGGK